ncbi:MAG: hypothetical protein AB3N19_16880 [Ruegeria sp.]
MALSTPVSHGPEVRLNSIIAIVLVGAIGFFLGQNWQDLTAPASTGAEAQIEDWHGNVKRSYWPN